MSNQSVDTTTLGNSSSHTLGRVKWFNNKAGFGFITITSGERANTDMFVHHSGINVSIEQYKYLVQGEYVEFKVEKSTSGEHEYCAGDVSGINGGKLMCETRKEFRQMRTSYRDENPQQQTTSDENPPMPSKLTRTKSDYTSRTGKTSSSQETESKTPRGPRVSSSFDSNGPRAPRSRGEGPRDNAEWTLVTKGSKDTKKTSKPRSKAPPSV